MERCDLLVRDGYVVTLDDAGTIHDRGAIAVAGSRIVAVGPTAAVEAAHEAARTIDARGALVHPGFVDAHVHATLHTARDAMPQTPPAVGGGARAGFGAVSRWLNALEEDDEHAAALLACAEMARNGVTCFMEPGTAFSPDAVADAAERVGIRASVADPFLWDVEGGLEMASEIDRAPADRNRALDLLGRQLRRNQAADGLVRGHVAVYGSGSASDELERAASEAAAAARAVLTQHQSLDARDAEFDRSRFGGDALVHFAELGVLGPHCTFMHLNALTVAEVDAAAASGMSAVWHPGNFLYYGIGREAPSPAPALRAAGVNVAFGTDLAKAWTFGEVGWLGYLVARSTGDAFSPLDLLAMNTRGGARAVGLGDQLGALEPGRRADLVVRTDQLLEAAPGVDPVLNAVLVSRGKSVAAVVVAGRVIVERGRLMTVDEDEVRAAARASARRIAHAAGLRAA